MINVTSPSNQSHCYANLNFNQISSYSVSLTVTTDSGYVATLNKINYITVYPEPIANYEQTPSKTTIIEPLVNFTDTSLGYTKWWWYFGDNTSDSITRNPNHIYQSETAYTYANFLVFENRHNYVGHVTLLR